MSTSIHQNQSRVAGNKLSTKERSELLKATMEFLEGLLQNDESLKIQRIKLGATLLRENFPKYCTSERVVEIKKTCEEIKLKNRSIICDFHEAVIPG